MPQIKNISITKTTANDLDFLLMQNPTTGETYKISKGNLLSGLSTGGSTTPATDPFISNVILHLKGDGTNGTTTFVDSSASPKTISSSGNVTISTAQSKYGSSSIYFNGGFLNFAGALDTGMSSPFTIECWLRTANQLPQLFAAVDSNNNVLNNYKQLSNQGTNWGILKWGSGQLLSFGSAVFALNTWQHIAIVKNSSNVISLFVNGVKNAATLIMNESWQSSKISIGYNGSLQYPSYISGYVDSYRLTTAARYTTAFNPETDTYLAY